jgi:hypothetical protein
MTSGTPSVAEAETGNIAREYVRLVLAVGQSDPDYVDAYYGPPELRTESAGMGLGDIQRRASVALSGLRSSPERGKDELVRLRHLYLIRQLEALLARVHMLQGGKLSFDEEALSLYDAEPPTFSEEYFRGIVDELGSLLPGNGPVPERFEKFRSAFAIPQERLDGVFSAAIAEARKQTLKHIPLPPGEKFTVEYVTGKSWSGYNWYKGGSESLIQVNTDFPITIDRAVDLASHEGYPGHHVYNALLEKALVRERGWVEFSVYALFSPQSLIAEGTANYGIDMAFPWEERLPFERDILFPLAGLAGETAERFYQVHRLTQKLAYAGNEAARRYLDGVITREEAARWLVEYALMSADRAMQRTRFFDQYRAYVINYNLGQDMVRAYIEKTAGPSAIPARRWEEFAKLLASPRLPSGLR